jgi:TonB family protein
MSVEVRVWRSQAQFADEPDPQPRPRPGGVSYRAWQSWITPADMPADLRARPMDSATQLLLDIDAAGRATRCRIVAPSVDPRLDSLACALLPRRGTFEPGYLGPGRPVAARWLMAVTWDVRSVEEREEQARNAPPAVGFPPPSRGSTGWPRLAWSQHVRPEALPPIQADYPAAARGREGVVSLELTMSGPEGITGCTVGVSAGDAALDEAACRVVRRLDLRYDDPCGVCLDDPLPLQVVWRAGGSHIRLPLLSAGRGGRTVPLPRDPADDRTATFYRSHPQPLAFSLSREDFRSLPIAALTNRRPAAELSVDGEGRVTACRITHSTGNAAFDARICQLLQARQRYTPATDVFGDPAPATAHRWLNLEAL